MAKKKEKLLIGEFVFGKAEIVVYKIKGKNKGPKVGLIGMTHGTEYIGAKIIDKLYQEINSDKLNGSIIAIPIANPFAAAIKDNNTPAGFGKAYTSISLNSQYPGDIEGDLTKQLAATIFNLIKDADYLIDIHSGMIISNVYLQARIRTDEEIKDNIIEKSRKLAQYSMLNLIVETKSSDISKDTKGILITQASLHNIPSVTLEFLGGYVKKEDVNLGLKSVYNILKGVNCLEGGHEKINQKTYTKLTKIHSPQAGIIDFEKELGEEMKKGETYAIIKDLLSEKISKLTAPANGIIGSRVSFGIVNKGDYIAEFLS